MSYTHEQYEADLLDRYLDGPEPEYPRHTFWVKVQVGDKVRSRKVYRDSMNCLHDAETHRFVREAE